eukprot:g4651.t1
MAKASEKTGGVSLEIMLEKMSAKASLELELFSVVDKIRTMKVASLEPWVNKVRELQNVTKRLQLLKAVIDEKDVAFDELQKKCTKMELENVSLLQRINVSRDDGLNRSKTLESRIVELERELGTKTHLCNQHEQTLIEKQFEIDAGKRSIEAGERKIEEQKSAIESLSQALRATEDKFESRHQMLLERCQALETEARMLRDENASLSRRLHDSTSELKAEQESGERARRQNIAYTQAMEEQENEMENIRKELEFVQTKLRQAERFKSAIQDEKRDLQNEVDEWRNEAREAADAVMGEGLKRERETLSFQRKAAEADQRASEAEAEANRLREELAECAPKVRAAEESSRKVKQDATETVMRLESDLKRVMGKLEEQTGVFESMQDRAKDAGRPMIMNGDGKLFSKPLSPKSKAAQIRLEMLNFQTLNREQKSTVQKNGNENENNNIAPLPILTPAPAEVMNKNKDVDNVRLAIELDVDKAMENALKEAEQIERRIRRKKEKSTKGKKKMKRPRKRISSPYLAK